MLAIALYLLGIGAYVQVSEDPIIFFASLVIGIVVVAFVCLLIYLTTKELFDKFTIFVVSMVYFFGLIILMVFGPTFIDRSISYHLAFYAVEEEHVDVGEIRDSFSTEIFDKRIHDAVVTGFLEENEDGSLSPTWKAKMLYVVLKPLGELTNSLDTYYSMKGELTNK